MLFTSDNKIFKKPLYSSYEEGTFELAKTLEEKKQTKVAVAPTKKVTKAPVKKI